MPKKSLQILSGFWMKVLAMTLMVVDHVAFFLINKYMGVNDQIYQVAYVLRCIGRISMPLFVFMAVEAVRYSHNGWKYFYRLLLMHLGITIALSIFIYAIPGTGVTGNSVQGNAFADLSIIVLTLLLLRLPKTKKLFALLPFGFMVLVYVIQVYEHANSMTVEWFPRFLRPDYSLLGLLMGLAFYYASPITEKVAKIYTNNMGIPYENFEETGALRRMKNVVSLALFFAVLVIFWGVSYIGYNYDFRPYDNYYMPMQSYCLLAIPLIFLYSGKRGYDSKAFRYITYFFYPVHLAILFFIFSL